MSEPDPAIPAEPLPEQLEGIEKLWLHNLPEPICDAYVEAGDDACEHCGYDLACHDIKRLCGWVRALTARVQALESEVEGHFRGNGTLADAAAQNLARAEAAEACVQALTTERDAAIEALKPSRQRILADEARRRIEALESALTGAEARVQALEQESLDLSEALRDVRTKYAACLARPEEP